MIDSDGILRMRKRRRRKWIDNGYYHLRVLICDNEWAVDDGGSSREIVNFMSDGNEMIWHQKSFLLVDFIWGRGIPLYSPYSPFSIG